MALGKKKRVPRKESIFYNLDGQLKIREAIDRLKDNVLYASIDGNLRVIQFESSLSGEAKTTTLANLAVALGACGKKVVAVDLDFRKPRLHHPFALNLENGISDYLIGKIDEKAMIKETSYENVSVITRGALVQNPTSVLTSEKMADLMKELREKFDFVLLDCPPVLMVSDYINITPLSDGVIFNVHYGDTKKAQVKEALGLLRKNNANIIGAVFSFYDPKRSNDYKEYGYYNYYSNSYGNGQ